MTKPTIVKRQLVNVIHHNKSKYDQQWFGRGQCIMFVEKLTISDGRTIKRVTHNTEPTVKFYMTNEEHQASHTHPLLAYPANQCDEYEIPVDKLLQDIATLTDQTAFYRETKGPGSNRRRQALHGHRF